VKCWMLSESKLIVRLVYMASGLYMHSLKFNRMPYPSVKVEGPVSEQMLNTVPPTPSNEPISVCMDTSVWP
jgi:hypothetical protein